MKEAQISPGGAFEVFFHIDFKNEGEEISHFQASAGHFLAIFKCATWFALKSLPLDMSCYYLSFGNSSVIFLQFFNSPNFRF